MNEWSQRTLQLVTTRNYLDRLQEIYPHEEGDRNVDMGILNSIEVAFNERNDIALLNYSLDLEKFPYKDSYVGFLRKDRSAIGRNPLTVKRICDRLYEKGIDEIVRGAKESMEANRRRGNKFSEWTKKNFKLVGIDEFKTSKSGVVLLNTSELEAKDFCNREMGVGISKRPDLVAKSNSSYVIGEAKFLSQLGGSQDRGFDDGMILAKNPSGKAYKVFIMDGVYWIAMGNARYEQIVYGTAAVFSALLLTEFLQSLALNKM
jgi:hypothetical protein